MEPQELSVAELAPLAKRLAHDLAGLGPQQPTPVLIVDSPFAIQGLKMALAQQGWPGAERGQPLPWCGTLEQAFDRLIDQVSAGVGVGGSPEPRCEIAPPRSKSLRQAHLAQMLLDHRGLGASLGGSAQAALNLAEQWVDLFEGWEWLSQAGYSYSPTVGGQAIAAEIDTLKNLAQENRQSFDRVPWAAQHARRGAADATTIVWFCMGQSPSPREKAMAQVLFGVSPDDCRMYAPPAVSLEELTEERLRTTRFAPRANRRLIAAHNVEESAWAAAQAILQWRAQGLNDIGVVPLDRKAVRRLRALLDRAGEPFADRTGWSLDTTVAASAVKGLAELLCHRASTQSFLEWIHGPFVARAVRARYGMGSEERQALDAALRGFGRVAPIRLADLVNQGFLPVSAQALADLAHDQRSPLRDWCDRLQEALSQSGLEEVLSQDAAGQAILAALQGLRADGRADASAVSVTLWQAVLSELLSQSRFAEIARESAVRVCSLSSLMWRPPQALIIMGAESVRLPERPVPRFFEPHCLAEMGLVTAPEQRESELLSQFVEAWRSGYPIELIACSDKPDSEVEFSGWVELLTLGSSALIQRKTAVEVLSTRELHVDPVAFAPSLQATWTHELPAALSVSELQSLADCATQFYLQTLLQLKPVPALEETSPPSDLGSLLHLVLKAATHSQRSELEWAQWAEAEVDRILKTSFFQASHQQSIRLPMPSGFRESLRAEALAVVPPLAQWLAQRPQSMQVLTEHSVSRPLEQLGILIKGRIDRIEQTARGLQLIDFKTTAPEQLRRRVKTIGLDVQLPLYAWLLAPTSTVESAAYISLRRDAITAIPLSDSENDSLQSRIDDTISLLSSKLADLRAGRAIEPEGLHKDKTICERCRVRGICRRDDIAGVEESEEEAE